MPHLTRFLQIVAIAGCRAPEASTMPDDGATPAAKPAGAPEAGRPASVPQAGPGNVAPTPAEARLALDSDGLRIFLVPSGTSRMLSFGARRPDTLRALEAVRAGASGTAGENVDCGASTVTWPDGLTVWFAQDRFVGWSVASAAAPLSTAGGLRVGATRVAVEGGASVARIAPSTIGEEFTAGGIGGLLESSDAKAKVTSLWAGATCIAR